MSLRYPAAALILFAAQLSAQPGDWMRVQGIAPGADVRVDVAGGHGQEVHGNLQSVTADSLVVNANGSGPQTFARQDITRVSIRKADHRTRNALIGLGVGAAAGLVIGASSRCDNCLFSNGTNTGRIVVGAITGVGALVGIVTGAVIPTAGWRAVYKR
ncbi:MAG TPA: hypothetical protein VGL53_31100 [Bryobacteraceae bacterium]|jgi:hypothetical protein